MPDKKYKSPWLNRSKKWAQTSVPGKSQDDTFNQMIINEVGIKPGEKILDLATGTGNPAISIALSLKGRGSVTCTDLTLHMLETARSRAKNLSLDVMTFAAANMSALPFPNGVFDCVTCRFGIMFPKNKVHAALEANRVLKPGGRIAYLVWGPYALNPPFYVPRRTVAAYFGEEEGPEPARHAMNNPGSLSKILKKAGYVATEERELHYKNPITDLDAYVTNGLKRSFADKIEGKSQIEIDRLKHALFSAWEPFKQEGIVQAPNYARLGLGRKAS